VKPYKVSVYCTVFAKHCNFSTKIDSPLSANGKTPQKFLQQLAVVLSLKVWERIFKMTTMAPKRRLMFFMDMLKSSESCLIKHFKKLLPYFCYKSV